MSCYEWQNGDIKIPTKAFSTLHRGFIKGFNDIQLRRLRNLKALFDYVMIAGKGKRNYEYSDMMELHANMYSVSFADIEMLFPNGRKKPLHPTKKMFGLANSKHVSFGIDEGTAHIYFDKATYTVNWTVPENNHACERAHELPEAKLLFRLLDSIKYTRNSGGQVVGNDEYNRDQIEAGMGANYVVFSYGK